jgi:hypothetical protein
MGNACKPKNQDPLAVPADLPQSKRNPRARPASTINTVGSDWRDMRCILAQIAVFICAIYGVFWKT